MKEGNPIKCAHCGGLTRYDMPCSCGYGTVLCPECNRPMIKLARCEPCARGKEEATARKVCTETPEQATIEEDVEVPNGDSDRG